MPPDPSTELAPSALVCSAPQLLIRSYASGLSCVCVSGGGAVEELMTTKVRDSDTLLMSDSGRADRSRDSLVKMSEQGRNRA